MIPKNLLSLIVIGLFFIVGCTQEVLYDDFMKAPQKIDDMETPQKIDSMEVLTPDRVKRQIDEYMEIPKEIDDLETPKTTLYFTLANERSPNRNVKIMLNGKSVYNDELKFGFGTSEKVDFETVEGTFSFELTDTTTNKIESTTINTENGAYIAVGFWGDSITIDQSNEKQVRYD